MHKLLNKVRTDRCCDSSSDMWLRLPFSYLIPLFNFTISSILILCAFDLTGTFLCCSQLGQTSSPSTIRTCFRKKASLPAQTFPQPCPQKRVHQPGHLLHLQVSTQPAPRKGHLLPTVALSSANSTRVNICVRPSGKRASVSRTESSESFQRRGPFLQQPSGDFSSSLPAKDPLADPFAPSSPPRHTAREADRFASFDKVSTSPSPSPAPDSD